MNKLNKFFNQRGMSLINVMMGIGLTSILGIAMMRMTRTSTQAQMGLKANNEFVELSSLIQSRLLKRDYCDYSFGPLNPNGGAFAVPDTDPDENSVPVDRLVKPLYTFDPVTQQQQLSGTAEEFVIPADVDMDDPRTGLQYGTISLMGMNLVRMPGSNELFLELVVMPRNSGTAGVQSRTKRIPLQVVFDTNSLIEECYSDFSGTVATATLQACEQGLGGSLDANNNCVDIPEICLLKEQVYMLQGQNVGPIALCGFNFEIADGGPGILTSDTEHTLPNNYVPETLQVALLGAGGGGGCSGQGSDANAKGQGGRRGKINIPAFSSKFLPANTTITYSLGSGGSNGFCDDGGDGGNTNMSFAGFSFSAQGGKGGAKYHGGDKPGQGVTFMGTSYAGGTPGNESSGGDGGIGSGGGGGDQAPVLVRKRGGKGGKGAVYIQYKVWTKTPIN